MAEGRLFTAFKRRFGSRNEADRTKLGHYPQPCFVSPKFLYRRDERLFFLSILFAVVLHNPCSYQLCDFDSRGRQSHRSKSCATFRW